MTMRVLHSKPQYPRGTAQDVAFQCCRLECPHRRRIGVAHVRKCRDDVPGCGRTREGLRILRKFVSQCPLPQDTGTSADSDAVDALNANTWTTLNIDQFLQDWVAANLTAADSNNVQALSHSFGAPNFFCSIDSFYNAGQPCLPVDPLLDTSEVVRSIQNWNSYMNSVNTAINFASSIMPLYLPGVVSDLYHDITPLKDFYKMFCHNYHQILGPCFLFCALITGHRLEPLKARIPDLGHETVFSFMYIRTAFQQI
ncbi:hypothetical protein EDB80DRAFT_868071 [Ilyonectria destructans]|nr:hypothetical protein EDB80DRAFT_868071 [Ilyonectria destructans]